MIKKRTCCGTGLALLISLTVLLLTGCFAGYVGSEGEVLKKYVPPEQLKMLVDNPDDSIWIVDVRPSSSYQKGHIPSAKSFPSSEILSRLDEMPKDIYLIMYCETGGRAQSVIKKLEKQGYTRLMNWGGMSRWPYDRASGSE